MSNPGRVIPVLAMFLWLTMLVAPTTLMGIKTVLLSMTVGGLVVSRMFDPGRYRLHRDIAVWCGVYLLAGLLFAFLGAVNGGRGALAVLTTYAVWPIVFCALLTILTHEKQLVSVVRLWVWAGGLVLLYIGLFTLSMTGLISPQWVPQIYAEGQSGLAIGEGYLEVSVRQLSSLLFLGPCFIGLLLAWPASRSNRGLRIWVALIVVGALLVAVFGGRRALLVAMVVGLIVAMALVLFLPVELRRVAHARVRALLLAGAGLLVSTVVLLSTYLQFDLWAYLEFMATGLDFDEDRSAMARRDQFWALLHGWLDHPWFGAGHGTSVHGLIRSNTHPWAYELSYVALLFQTGIVGVLIYASGILWILIQGVRIIRQGGIMATHMVAALAGMVAFLVGNATNPYLQKFDFMFVLFYPLALINMHLISAHRPASACQVDQLQSNAHV